MKRSKAFYIKMITSSLTRRRSRMLVALLAIAVGATILSGLVTIYYDIPRQMGKEFRSYGTNLILIPDNEDGKIKPSQLEAIESELPQEKVVGFAPFAYKNAKINQQPFMIAATNIEQAHKNSPYWLIEGTWPKAKKEVLVGNEVAKKIDLKLNDKFVLNTVRDNGEETISELTVAGILTTGGTEESFVFMSLEDYDNIDTVEPLTIDVIECSIEANSEELKAISDDMIKRLDGVLPRPVKRLSQSQDLVLGKLQALVWIVTFIVLVLTMISVSTTMMAVVAERKKAIGLKKALGATNDSIVWEFLGEGALLGIIGGIIGSGLGYVFANEVSLNVFARAIQFPVLLAPTTIVLSTIVTIIACLIPVRRTVYIEPALVLRGE